MSQESGSKAGAAEPDRTGPPIPTSSTEAMTTANVETGNGSELPRRESPADDSRADPHRTEAAVNAALDTAIDDVANLLTDQGPADQRTIQEPANNGTIVGMLNPPQSSSIATPPTDVATDSNAGADPDRSDPAAEKGALPKPDADGPDVADPTAVPISEENAARGAADKDSRHTESQEPVQSNEEQSRLSADITREFQMPSKGSVQNSDSTKPEIQTSSDPAPSEPIRGAKPESAAVEKETTANDASASKREMVKRKSSRGKNKKPPKDSQADDANDGNSETLQDADDTKDKDSAQSRKKNRQKSKPDRANVDVAGPAVMEDPETTEIKQRIKQFSDVIRSAAAAGKPQTEPDDDSNRNPVTTSRRLSADAMEFVPSSAATSTSPPLPTTLPAATATPAPTSALPPTAVDAPEFVPTSSSQPVLTRPGSVKNMISKFDQAPSKDQAETKRSDGSNHGADNSPRDSVNDGSVRNEPHKPEPDVAVPKPSDTAHNLPPGPESQSSTKPAVQDRIKQFNTASQAPPAKESELKADDPTGGDSPPAQGSIKDKPAATLDEINLDVAEEEVLEAPSPSIALVKKPTAEPNDRGLHQRARPQTSSRNTGTEAKPADSPANAAASNPGNGTAKPAESKDRIEKALKTRMTSEPPKAKRPMPFVSADPNPSAKAENAPAPDQNADQPLKASPGPDKPQETKAISDASVGQSSVMVSDQNKQQQDTKMTESKQAVESKPGPAITSAQAPPKQQPDQLQVQTSSSKSCCVIV